jgi:hypothetical protein
MADECAEGIKAEPLPCSTIEAVEPFMTNGRCEDTSVDEVGILALVNGNLPAVGETIGRPVAELEDLQQVLRFWLSRQGSDWTHG